MKITKLQIKNLFGIKEMDLDNKSIELSGTNGVGKTSVLDAIKYALTNNSDRDYIIRKGEKEGEIIIETDTGLVINRKKRVEQSDYKSIKENGKNIHKPETFLQEIFTDLQLNPVEFCLLDKNEQNRRILDLIEFDWDLNWIRDQFGEIPEKVNYQQNILKVLHEIQKEDGAYFQNRQDINREIRNNIAMIEDIAKDIPKNYDYEKWSTYDSSTQYQELAKIKEENNKIQRAQAFKDSYENKKRGYQAEKEIAIAQEERQIANTRENLKSEIERMKAEIIAAEEKLQTLDEKLKDKISVIEAQHSEKLSKLDSDIGIASEYTEKPLKDTAELENEITIAETMIKHLNEYKRMQTFTDKNKKLEADSKALTEKIELARTLPAQILKEATIPVEGLTVVDGLPLINGLPVSNLSEGEKLKLCVDIAVSKPNSLQIILLDGTEKLSDENRAKLYQSCKEKGLQFVATRTTNNNELEIVTL